jgi:hypothetical protein
MNPSIIQDHTIAGTKLRLETLLDECLKGQAIHCSVKGSEGQHPPQTQAPD